MVGPYFTYLAGGGHEGAAPSATWSTVPPCVKQAREMIEHLAVKNAGFEVFKVDQMTILGWHSPGSRKVCTVIDLTGITLNRPCPGKSAPSQRQSRGDALSWRGYGAEYHTELRL